MSEGEVEENPVEETPVEETAVEETPESAGLNIPAPEDLVGMEEAEAPAPLPLKDPVINERGESLGTGRRKSAVARVRIKAGSGEITVNKRPLDEYFNTQDKCVAAVIPLTFTEQRDAFDVMVNVRGGGPTGQADAIKLGVARALARYKPELERTLRKAGMLTRDARVVERKKYGHKKARRSFQFSKR